MCYFKKICFLKWGLIATLDIDNCLVILQTLRLILSSEKVPIYLCEYCASNTEISSRISSHFTIEKQCVICRTPPQAVIDPAIFAEGWIHFQLFSCEICHRCGGMEARFKKKTSVYTCHFFTLLYFTTTCNRGIVLLGPSTNKLTYPRSINKTKAF